MFLTAVLGYIIIFFTSLSQPYSYSVERPALRRLILQVWVELLSVSRIFYSSSNFSIQIDGFLTLITIRSLEWASGVHSVLFMIRCLNLKDTGVLIVPMDYRGSLDLPDYTFLSASKPASECCSSNDSFCGFPFYLPVKQLFFEYSNNNIRICFHSPLQTFSILISEILAGWNWQLHSHLLIQSLLSWCHGLFFATRSI